MSCSLRILTTATVDSTPSLILVAPNGDKILVNCGEGCQRAFLETTGLKLKSVKRICLTHLHPTALGGLPGLFLTLADASENATLAAAAFQQEKANKRNAIATLNRQEFQRPPTEVKHEDEQKTGGIELHGPTGTQAFVHSLRHFMRRDRFGFVVREGEQDESHQVRQEPALKKVKKSNSDVEPSLDFTIQAVEFQHAVENGATVPIQSFIFRTPPLVGRFQPDRAAELGIPKGRMYAQLKNGNSVTFVKDGKEITVQPHQVLEDGHPGLAILVVYCPTEHVLRQMKTCTRLQLLEDSQKSQTTLDLMVHITPRALIMDEYKTWVKSFPTSTTHIWMDAFETINYNLMGERTPFVAASLGGMMRSMIHAGIYPSPLQEESEENELTNNDFPWTATIGKRHLEYVLIPLHKKGVKADVMSGLWKEKLEEAKLFVKESGALEAVVCEAVSSMSTDVSDSREILFTGTGSALPCKHRNVTGICLTIAPSKRMLLDCGEGTVGQLMRSNNSNEFRLSLLQSIHAVWISHPHADHHLGVLRLLSERRMGEPIILIAPPNLFAFLTEYELIDPSIRGSYRWLNCYDLITPSTPASPLAEELESRLGITSIVSVPVSHCRDAFAVVLDTPKDSLGRIAYSGDCRPSTKFAEVAMHADILIHEATFEDGMENEAMLKKHCTVGEAILVASWMKAKAVLLTHFSQRYPKMPLLKQSTVTKGEDQGMPVVFCFDFMKLTPRTIPYAAKLTDAMRLLYPDLVIKRSSADTDHEVDVKSMMSIPGLFAQSELL